MTRQAYRPPDPANLAWVLERRGASHVVRIERLIGGITADVDRLVLGRAGRGSEHVVLRRWSEALHEVGPVSDGLVEREAAALTVLGASPVPAPRLLAADPTGTKAGVRCLLMSALPGAVDLVPRDVDAWVAGLARAQAEVHALPAVLTDRSAGWFEADADLGWIPDTGLAHAALEAALEAAVEPADADDVFVHGDFQPFNVLWRTGSPTGPRPGGSIVGGVVDWPNAGTGPRGVDVGHCRLNLAVLASADVAADYLQRYESFAGVQVDTSTQVRALLSWDRDWQRFIPIQVAGRASVDVAGMAQRVVDTIRRTLDRRS